MMEEALEGNARWVTETAVKVLKLTRGNGYKTEFNNHKAIDRFGGDHRVKTALQVISRIAKNREKRHTHIQWGGCTYRGHCPHNKVLSGVNLKNIEIARLRYWSIIRRRSQVICFQLGGLEAEPIAKGKIDQTAPNAGEDSAPIT